MIITLEQLRKEYQWLALSPLGQTFENDGEFDVPVCSINEPNFSVLLKVLRFWQIENFSSELTDQLFKFDKNIVKEVITNQIFRESEKNFYMKIYDFLSVRNGYLCYFASTNGYLDWLKYAHEKGCHRDRWICIFASANGHFDCLKYAHEQGSPLDKDAFLNAAKHGHLNCLKYVHENGRFLDIWLCKFALKRCHPNCLEYLQKIELNLSNVDK